MDTRRIPSLDGLRAIAILAVLLGHLQGCRNSPVPWLLTSGLLPLANLGVRTFFVISGYLITELLLRELTATGSISLQKFYFRRTFRIFPAYYAYIAVIAACSSYSIFLLRPGDLLHAVTYTMNYHADHAWHLGHAWSLSVEEQFYLLWPATLAFLGVRSGMKAAAAVLVVAPVMRFVYFVIRPEGIDTDFTFETVSDAIAVGCLLAGYREALWQRPAYRTFLSSRWMLVIPATIVCTGFLAGGIVHSWNPAALQEMLHLPGIAMSTLLDFFYELAGITVINVCLVIGLDWCLRFSEGMIGRVLNSAPLVWIGGLSYSIYLWQQPFLNRAEDRDFAAFPRNLALMFVAALCSYSVVERPMLHLRDAIARRLWPKRPLPEIRPTSHQRMGDSAEKVAAIGAGH